LNLTPCPHPRSTILPNSYPFPKRTLFVFLPSQPHLTHYSEPQTYLSQSLAANIHHSLLHFPTCNGESHLPFQKQEFWLTANILITLDLFTTQRHDSVARRSFISDWIDNFMCAKHPFIRDSVGCCCIFCYRQSWPQWQSLHSSMLAPQFAPSACTG